MVHKEVNKANVAKMSPKHEEKFKLNKWKVSQPYDLHYKTLQNTFNKSKESGYTLKNANILGIRYSIQKRIFNSEDCLSYF